MFWTKKCISEQYPYKFKFAVKQDFLLLKALQ